MQKEVKPLMRQEAKSSSAVTSVVAIYHAVDNRVWNLTLHDIIEKQSKWNTALLNNKELMFNLAVMLEELAYE